MAKTYTLTAKAEMKLVDNLNATIADFSYTHNFSNLTSDTTQRGDIVATTSGVFINVNLIQTRGVLYLKNEEDVGASPVRIDINGTGIITILPQEWIFAPIDIDTDKKIKVIGVTANATINYLLIEQ